MSGNSSAFKAIKGKDALFQFSSGTTYTATALAPVYVENALRIYKAVNTVTAGPFDPLDWTPITNVGITGGTNNGNASGTLYISNANNAINLRTISGGTNVTVQQIGNVLRISAIGGGTGSTTFSGITSFANVGSGAGCIGANISGGDNLDLRTISGGSRITVATVGNVVRISTPVTQGITGSSSCGAGTAVLKDVAANVLRLRSLSGGSNVTLSVVGDIVRISAASSGSPGGSNTQLQFNNAGAFAGDACLTFNNTQKSLTLGTRSGIQGTCSASFGVTNIVSGNTSFGIGQNNCATGLGSFVSGCGNRSACNYSHAEGTLNFAGGNFSHAEGSGTCTTGIASHAEGENTRACGNYSHAEGSTNCTLGIASHAEGSGNIVSGNFSHAEGCSNTVTGQSAHAEGILSFANACASHAEGCGSIAKGSGSHAEGCFTQAIGIASHAEGSITFASGLTSHSEGTSTRSIGQSSHAEGFGTCSVGNFSHAEGCATKSCGVGSHAEGCGTCSVGTGSHAEGTLSISVGNYSHAAGCDSRAVGDFSTTIGQSTCAVGVSSFAGGKGLSVAGKWINACGLNSFNHSENDNSQVANHGANARSSAILGGINHNIETGNTNSVILGGSTIKLTGNTYANFAAVGSLAIFTTPATGGTDVLTWTQSNKKVSRRSLASIVTPPAGGNTQLQFNNGGAFGASSNLTYNTGTNTLSTPNFTTTAAATIGSNLTVTNNLQIHGQAWATQTPLIDGASISWNLDVAPNADVTLAGNRVLSNPTNMKAGGTYFLIVKQDGSGNRTLSYSSAYKWSDGTVPVLSTAGNAVDILTFISDGTNMYGVHTPNLS